MPAANAAQHVKKCASWSLEVFYGIFRAERALTGGAKVPPPPQMQFLTEGTSR